MTPDTLPAAIEKLANERLARQPFGGILRVSEYPVLREMIPFERYESATWVATRRQVDQLDQVTFGRKH